VAGSGQIPCGTVATLIAGAPFMSYAGAVGAFTAVNGTGATLFIGGPTVTSANGFAVPASGTLPTQLLYSGDQIFGITASGTTTVSMFQTGA
jgi:hypothetical protein